jgi:integrase
MQLTHHVDLVIPVTSSTPNRHTHATIRVADAWRDQSSPIATRITLNTGSAKTRHTFVSIMSDNGISIKQIADLVGHRTTIVTQKVYRHQLKPVISTGATAMNAIFNKKSA